MSPVLAREGLRRGPELLPGRRRDYDEESFRRAELAMRLAPVEPAGEPPPADLLRE